MVGLCPEALSMHLELLLIPRSKPTPRSTSMPRSKSKPRYPLYSSLMFHHYQAPISIAAKHPCPATIPIYLPSSAKASLTNCTLRIVSAGGNEAATFCSSAPHTLATRSQPFRKDDYPSSVSICSLPLFYHPSLFN